MTELKFSNLTATTKICDRDLNLEEMARKLRNITYNPRKFNAIIMRIRTPAVTGLIFHTGIFNLFYDFTSGSLGKMVVVGAKSVEDTKKGARRIARAVQKATSARIYCGKIDLHNIAAYM